MILKAATVRRFPKNLLFNDTLVAQWDGPWTVYSLCEASEVNGKERNGSSICRGLFVEIALIEIL